MLAPCFRVSIFMLRLSCGVVRQRLCDHHLKNGHGACPGTIATFVGRRAA
jgi:hypothetical protein